MPGTRPTSLFSYETDPVITTAGAQLLNSNDVVGMYADMGTLAGVGKMFRDPSIHLPAWMHYLAFDLMAGHYLVQKNLA